LQWVEAVTGLSLEECQAQLYLAAMRMEVNVTGKPKGKGERDRIPGDTWIEHRLMWVDADDATVHLEFSKYDGIYSRVRFRRPDVLGRWQDGYVVAEVAPGSQDQSCGDSDGAVETLQVVNAIETVSISTQLIEPHEPTVAHSARTLRSSLVNYDGRDLELIRHAKRVSDEEGIPFRSAVSRIPPDDIPGIGTAENRRQRLLNKRRMFHKLGKL
jgi:hypothetical protein